MGVCHNPETEVQQKSNRNSESNLKLQGFETQKKMIAPAHIPRGFHSAGDGWGIVVRLGFF